MEILQEKRRRIRDNLNRMSHEERKDSKEWSLKDRRINLDNKESFSSSSLYYIELTKALVELSFKEDELMQLKQEITQMKNTMFDASVKKRYEEQIQELKEQLSNLNITEKEKTDAMNKKILQLEQEKEQIGKKFKQHLIDIHLNGKESLLEKPLEFLEEVIEQIKINPLVRNNRTEKKENVSEIVTSEGGIDEETEKDISVISLTVDPLSEDYLNSEMCACGKVKHRSSKGCPKCRGNVDAIRKRENVDWYSAWQIHWQNLGII